LTIRRTKRLPASSEIVPDVLQDTTDVRISPASGPESFDAVASHAPIAMDARSSGLVLEPCRSVANRAFRSDLSALDRAQLMLREIAVWFPSMSEGDRADLSFQPGYIV
jgi:hypothetical protein